MQSLIEDKPEKLKIYNSKIETILNNSKRLLDSAYEKGYPK